LKDVQIEKLDWREFLEGEMTATDEKALNDYFDKFTKPNGHCPGCKKEFAEGIIAILGGGIDTVSVEWGMQHGEARCRGCGWPYRGLHYDVGPIKKLGPWFLSYHPEFVGTKKKANLDKKRT